MAVIHHNINTVAYDATAIAGVVSCQWSQVGSQAVSLIAGDGTAEHYVVEPTAVSGAFTGNSLTEMEKMASKVAATKNATFKVNDAEDNALTVTITKIKTSAVLGGQNSLAGAGPFTVQFVADSVSNPA